MYAVDSNSNLGYLIY